MKEVGTTQVRVIERWMGPHAMENYPLRLELKRFGNRVCVWDDVGMMVGLGGMTLWVNDGCGDCSDECIDGI